MTTNPASRLSQDTCIHAQMSSALEFQRQCYLGGGDGGGGARGGAGHEVCCNVLTAWCSIRPHEWHAVAWHDLHESHQKILH